MFSCLDEFGKIRGPLLPPAQREQAQSSGPAWARLCRGGVVAGRPGTPQGQPRGGTSHQAHPGAPGSRGRGREPQLPNPEGAGAVRLHPRLACKPPTATPGRARDSRALSGCRGLVPGRLAAPRALRVRASHSSELGALAAPARASRSAGRTGPWAGRRRQGGGGRVGRWRGGAVRRAGGEERGLRVPAAGKAG